MAKISHRFPGLFAPIGGTVTYSKDGIEVKPILMRRGLLIPWQNIQFISTIPSVEYEENAWKTYDGRDLMDNDAIKNLDYLDFTIALQNRHDLTKNLSLLKKIWTRLNFPMIKPLFRADDKPDPTEGCIKYSISKNTLSCPIKDLLGFINRYGKYGLVVSFD